jgi:hypothetical protein
LDAPNGKVRRAAANDIDFKNRSAGGSVCNPLLLRVSGFVISD